MYGCTRHCQTLHDTLVICYFVSLLLPRIYFIYIYLNLCRDHGLEATCFSKAVWSQAIWPTHHITRLKASGIETENLWLIPFGCMRDINATACSKDKIMGYTRARHMMRGVWVLSPDLFTNDTDNILYLLGLLLKAPVHRCLWPTWVCLTHITRCGKQTCTYSTSHLRVERTDFVSQETENVRSE